MKPNIYSRELTDPGKPKEPPPIGYLQMVDINKSVVNSSNTMFPV